MAMEPRLAMMKAISEVLETMFFVSVDVADWDPPPNTVYRDSKIQIFNHAKAIELRFRLAADFARMAAANFLGIDEEEIQEEDLDDVMRELANMVGGNFLDRLDEDGFHLGIPSFEAYEGEMEAVSSRVQLAFMGDFAGVVLWEDQVRS